MKNKDEAYVAIIISGTYREIEYLLRLFPYMAGDVKYDIFLILRHVRSDESSHFGVQEADFNIPQIEPFMGESLFICELPYIDQETVLSKYLVPIGPTSIERECAMLSMYEGVFAGISMMEASLRPYTHVMKTRTDYLPWTAPWLSGMLELYNTSGKRIIIDGSLTVPQRYADHTEIQWQGSISDLFCFASVDQFLELWNIKDSLASVWTGIAETTLFRSIMIKLLDDSIQSHRRNKQFLNKYFVWQQNETKQSFHMLRSGVLSKEIKQIVTDLLIPNRVSPDLINKLNRITYDFIIGAILDRGAFQKDVTAKMNQRLYPTYSELEVIAGQCFQDKDSKLQYLNECNAAIKVASPI
jgi:hypothetical protein